jgi:integrase
MAEHAGKTTPRSEAEYRRLIDKIILPVLGRKQVRDVTRADISRLHHDPWDTSYQTIHAVAVLSKMFSLAELWGERPVTSNPCKGICKGIEHYPGHKHEQMWLEDELARLADSLKAHIGSPYVVAAIKLLVLTGARRNEIVTLRWEWIDSERGEVRGELRPDIRSTPRRRALDWLANHALYVFDKMRCRLLACDGEADHLHTLVEYPPKHSISVLANAFKGTSSRLLRMERPDSFPLARRRPVVAGLLRGFNRRRHVGRRQTVCRTAETARFLLALRGEEEAR